MLLFPLRELLTVCCTACSHRLVVPAPIQVAAEHKKRPRRQSRGGLFMWHGLSLGRPQSRGRGSGPMPPRSQEDDRATAPARPVSIASAIEVSPPNSRGWASPPLNLSTQRLGDPEAHASTCSSRRS